MTVHLVLLEEASSGREGVVVKDLQGLLSSDKLPKRIMEDIRVENEAGGGWTDTIKFRYRNKIILSQALTQTKVVLQ